MADKSLNRTELVAAVAAESGQSQVAVNGAVDAIFAVLATSVGEGTKVSISARLAVERTHRSARTGRNPRGRPARPSRSRRATAEGFGRKQAQGCR